MVYCIMSSLQTNYHLKLISKNWTKRKFPGKWLIHSTKHHKDNQVQSLELPCSVSWLRI